MWGFKKWELPSCWGTDLGPWSVVGEPLASSQTDDAVLKRFVLKVGVDALLADLPIATLSSRGDKVLGLSTRALECMTLSVGGLKQDVGPFGPRRG